MLDIDEDGSLKPYTGHYAMVWVFLSIVIWVSFACGGVIMYLILRH